MCADHTENGVCIKRYCRKRHPKTCRYFLRGFCRRNSSCKYLHSKHNQAQSCNKCEKTNEQTYYCEVCGKTFCSQCTVEEAHTRNIYKAYEKVS